MVALAASGVVALGVVIAVFALTRGGGGSDVPTAAEVATALEQAGCTYVERGPAPFPSDHSKVPSLNTPTKGFWNTFPPAAGAHYGQFAVWGFYRTPVNPRQVVHNEEHGAVVLWWGPQTPASTVDALEGFYQEQTDSMFGTPIAGLGSKVAITAWSGNPNTYFQNGDYGIGHSAVCPNFDDKVQDAFAKFRERYRGTGPEFPRSVSLRVNKPGAGAG
jgi:Protein of unknown function (DUF3105)